LAENGDILKIPGGSNTGTNTVTAPDDKKIIIIGSGMETTVISSLDSTPGNLINLGRSGSRITEMDLFYRTIMVVE
jgi:hypothetical protein